MKKTVLTLGLLLLSFTGLLLCAGVIKSLGNTYNLDIIKNYTFVQIIGVLMILEVVFYKHKPKEEPKKEYNKILELGFESTITKMVFYLLVWLFANSYFLILN